MPALLFCSRLLLLGIFALVILSRRLRGGRGLRGRWGLGVQLLAAGLLELEAQPDPDLASAAVVAEAPADSQAAAEPETPAGTAGAVGNRRPPLCSCTGSANATNEHRRNDEQHHRDHATDQKTHNSSGDRPAEGTAQFSGVVAVAAKQ